MQSEYEKINRDRWINAIKESFGLTPPLSKQFIDHDSMIHVLTPFMGDELNHILLPDIGGLDIYSIAHSPEPGCLEFNHDCHADTFCPSMLSFEYFPESPWNSFFLMETKPLLPCGVYDNNSEYEEVCEISPGEYVDINHYETGVLGYDEDHNEIKIPENSRRVSRRMKGKFLIVAKTSFWNMDTSTYDGRHDIMSASEIRNIIQNAINKYKK